MRQQISASRLITLRRALPWLALVATSVVLSACTFSGQFQRVARGGEPEQEEIVTSAPEPVEQAADKAPPEQQTGTSPPAESPTTAEPVEPAKPAEPDALAQWCKAIAGRLFSVALSQCQDKGFADSGYRSVQNRVIAVREIMPAQTPARGRVLLIGGTHGDELTSVSLIFWWLDMLADSDSDIHWRVAPAMNPDGVLAQPAQRLNANNIDLNRNLPTPGWQKASRAYWQETGKAPRRYPGSEAASEPETRWLMHEVESFKPDVIISVHAPYGVLDYDGEYPPPLQLGELQLHRLGVFPGSLGNYGSRFLGIPVMTVELDHATRMPSRAQARAMWRDLHDWLKQYLGSSPRLEAKRAQGQG